MNHVTRKTLYQQIEKERKTRVLALVTSDRPNAATRMASDMMPSTVSVLDKIGPVPKISFIMDTHGGQTAAAWRLVNLIRSFCDELEVIVPTKAMSAGTLIALGADKIVMTKQAVLGPIDPSLDHPLAPSADQNGQQVKVSVSAEAIRGYLDEAAKSVTDQAAMAQIWINLASHIHPAMLGEIFRVHTQIRFMAAELIKNQVKEAEKQQQIIQLLCSDSGSHDYTIDRRQAAALGLSIEKASAALYPLLSALNNSYNDELETFSPFNLQNAIASANPPGVFRLTRGLVESVDDCFAYVTEGQASGANVNTTDGWRRLV